MHTAQNLGQGSFLPPVFHYGFDHRIQKLQFLLCRAVQCFEPLIDGRGVNISHAPRKFFFPFLRLGMVHDQMDRRTFSNSGHLLGLRSADSWP